MNKKNLFTTLIFMALTLTLTSCPSIEEQQQQQQKQALEKQKREALSLSLEANLQYREVSVSCDWLGGKLVSKIVMVPLNKQIIDAAIDYKASRDALSESQITSLRQRSYKEFFESNKSTFVLVVVNNEKLETGKHAIGFENFIQNVQLYGKKGKPYKLVDYSRNLETRLNPGWNEGYIHFANFRENKNKDDLIKDYSVNINGYSISCDQKNYKTETWAFTFDESEVNFLAEIQSGLNVSQIKDKYVTNKYEAVGLKPEDVSNLVRFVMTISVK